MSKPDAVPDSYWDAAADWAGVEALAPSAGGDDEHAARYKALQKAERSDSLKAMKPGDRVLVPYFGSTGSKPAGYRRGIVFAHTRMYAEVVCRDDDGDTTTFKRLPSGYVTEAAYAARR